MKNNYKESNCCGNCHNSFYDSWEGCHICLLDREFVNEYFICDSYEKWK